MGQVSLRGVRKSFGSVDVIKGVDLEVDDGEFLVFVGPSGCGKSTMLRMIAGLESIDSGDLFIDGRRANDVRPADRGAAMVFQSYALYPHMTVAENMGFALKMAGIGRAERDAQVRRAADVLRIGDLLARMPRELSGGQRQRVAIGRAIVRKPRVFLFDEPLSNLDAALRVDMRIELSRLHRELGTTMIYVTHDQVEAMTMGTRIAVFNQGRIEQLGAPLSLYDAPANEFVAGFLGAPRINLVGQPAADATPVQRALWSLLLPAPDARARRAGVRPEHLRVGAPDAGVPATVVMAEHLGDVSVLHLRVDGLADLLHAKVDAGHAHLGAGATVGVVPDAGHVLAFACGRAPAADAPPPAERLRPPDGWVMTWHDEFDVDGLPDPGKWANDTYFNKPGWFNHEAQYYAAPRAENAVVRDGRLLITARKESLSSAPDWGGQRYTSARLFTRGLAEWTYGFFEIRAKLPCGLGTWPAIWMLGTQGDWPANGELDIMEHVGRNPGRVLSTIHTAAGSGAHGVGAAVTVPDACTAFHLYQMLWTERDVTFGIDGVEHLTYPRLDVGPAGAARAWPFDAPQFLILNLAIGGDLGGPVDDRVFPQVMEVDYVRVWQAPRK